MVEQKENQNEQTTDTLKVPNKFKNSTTGEIKVDELLKSYLALEKKLSSRQTLLPMKTQGNMPSSPEEYKIVMKNPKLVIDEEMNKKLFNLGFTNEQLQAVYDLAADKIIPLLENLSADYRADKEMAELEREFGGAEGFNTVARQISAWGEKNLKPDIFNALSTSKDGIMTIYKMMNEQTEPSILPQSSQTQETISNESLRALMRNPKYWKEQDPVFLKRVEDGFKRLYK
ncbi:MAG: hypothetical protein IKV03_04190 [Alphaproteobacteria bacterium]|nr:hypothetical protein [Alphaproteobacteria bacterium]